MRMIDLFQRVGGREKYDFVCAREGLRVLANDLREYYPAAVCYATILSPSAFVVSPEQNFILVVRLQNDRIWAIHPIISTGNLPVGVESMPASIWRLENGDPKQAVQGFADEWRRLFSGTLEIVTGVPEHKILTIVPRPNLGMRGQVVHDPVSMPERYIMPNKRYLSPIRQGLGPL